MNQRDRILGKADFSTRDVYVPEWDETVHVRSLGAAHLAELMDAISGRDKNEDAGRALLQKGRLGWLLACSLCSADGDRLFKDGEGHLFDGKNLSALLRVANAAIDLSVEGFAEGAEKNSPAARSGGSSTDSVSPSGAPTQTICPSPPPSSGTGSPTPASSPGETPGPTSDRDSRPRPSLTPYAARDNGPHARTIT